MNVFKKLKLNYTDVKSLKKIGRFYIFDDRIYC